MRSSAAPERKLAETVAGKATSRTYTNAHSREIGGYEISTAIRAPHIERAQSYRELVLAYATHPEPKSLGPDGTPCDRKTTGSCRHVTSTASQRSATSNEPRSPALAASAHVQSPNCSPSGQPTRRQPSPAHMHSCATGRKTTPQLGLPFRRNDFACLALQHRDCRAFGQRLCRLRLSVQAANGEVG